MTQHPAVIVPDRLFDEDLAEATWQSRFSAAQVMLLRSARDAQHRSIYLSNASGVWEIYGWDRATGVHRQVTKRFTGTYRSMLQPDGERVWWYADTDGDEFGHWMSEPFEDGAVAVPAVRGVPDGYSAGLQVGSTLVAVGTASDDGTTIWVSGGDGQVRAVYQHKEYATVDAMSRDQRLLAISHSEHGDSRHPAVRVVRTTDGMTVGEKWDGAGRGLHPLGFCQTADDQRLLLVHERGGREELLVWDLVTGTETEIVLDLPGELTACWYPDGSALLVMHAHSARTTLHRYHLATAQLTTMVTPIGTIADADVREDGSVEYSWSSSAEPPQVRVLHPDGTDRVLLIPPGETAAGSVPVTDAWVAGPAGAVHVLVARPAGANRPLPTVFCIHGGPHGTDEDRFWAHRAVWVDLGFAVVHVNYRGSAGYGSAWRDALQGRPGLTELEDVAVVHDWAVASGLADPDRSAFIGRSWGGYLALLALGTQQQRWAVVVAGEPVADYVTAYIDEMEPLRALDRAIFGGSPEDVPHIYEESSPLTYVNAVTAPVLVLAGENDPRCPIRQIDNYLDALAAAGKEYAVYRYDAGHSSLVVAETLRQVRAEIGFVRAALTV